MNLLYKPKTNPANESRGWTDDLDPATKNNVTCAIFMILYTNYLTTTRILDTYDKLKKNSEFCNKKFKVAAESFISIVRNGDMKVQKDFEKLFPKNFADGFVVMCDTIDDEMDPYFKSLEKSLENVFKEEYKLRDWEAFTQVYYMDILIGIAQRNILDLADCVPVLKTRLSRLDKSRAFEKSTLMCRLSNEKMVEDNVMIKLQKQLTLMSKRHTVLKKLRDADIFSKGFVAGGWKLDDDDPEYLPSGPDAEKTA